jgi:large subunit ribosomal protein L24
MAKTHIVKGDTVVVRRGKEKGKRGVVKAVFPTAGQATVEGLNIVKRHTKQGQESGNMGKAQSGGIIEKEAPFPISALMVVDPKDSNPTRVRRAKGKDGAVHRVAARSGEQLRDSAKGA